MTRASKTTKKRGSTSKVRAGAPVAKAKSNGNTPKFLAEFAEKGRDIQHEGLRHFEQLRGRIEDLPLARRLRERLDGGQHRIKSERIRLERWAGAQTKSLASARERLLHQLGLATTQDVKQISRKLNTLRGQLKGALPKQSRRSSKSRELV